MTTKSIDIEDFEVTLRNFIDGYDLAWKIKALVLERLLNEAVKRSDDEILQQAKERDAKEKLKK